MKIVFFIGNLSGGGKERRLISLISFLSQKRKDIEINLIILRKSVDYEEVYSLPININFIVDKDEKKQYIFVYKKLFKLVRKIKPDIINSWGSEETFYILPIAKFYRVKLINSQITDAPNNVNWFSQFGIQSKINFFFSDIILANSKAGLKSYGISKAKGKVIYNGFDFRRSNKLCKSDIVRQKYKIETEFIIGMVASFTMNKDYKTFISAAEAMISKYKNVSFLAIGGGEMLDEIKRQVKEANNRIIFTNHVTDVESLIRICDLGVLCTKPSVHGEGISNSIVEFMAFGKPVIATFGGGTPEIILNNKTGYIINPESKDELLNKIKKLIDNPLLIKKMGQKGQERIINNFSIEKMGETFYNLFISVNKTRVK